MPDAPVSLKLWSEPQFRQTLFILHDETGRRHGAIAASLLVESAKGSIDELDGIDDAFVGYALKRQWMGSGDRESIGIKARRKYSLTTSQASCQDHRCTTH